MADPRTLKRPASYADNEDAHAHSQASSSSESRNALDLLGSAPKRAKTAVTKPAAAKARKPAARKTKDVGTCSLTKKEIGDRVQSSLRLEKYALNQTMFTMRMDTAFFRSFFLQEKGLTNPIVATPSEFDDSTPVVVVEMENSQAGALLGVSKVKGGNRMATTTLRGMTVVFYPSKGRAVVWTSGC